MLPPTTTHLCPAQCFISTQASLRPTCNFWLSVSSFFFFYQFLHKKNPQVYSGDASTEASKIKNDILKASTSSNTALSFKETKCQYAESSVFCLRLLEAGGIPLFGWLTLWCAVRSHSAQSPPAHWRYSTESNKFGWADLVSYTAFEMLGRCLAYSVGELCPEECEH